MKFALSLFLFALTFSAWAQPQPLLSDKIPYPFFARHSDASNEVMSINDGMAAFQLRLEMIARAEKSIEVEYFIYDVDMAGKILTRDLIKAAQRGVKVRILIDKSMPIFEFDEYYAKALADHGIEVRYYNKAPLVRISTVQFRNHRKLIVVDAKEAITGGRNIGDDYFDLSDSFNFHDTDIYVRGSMAITMRDTFDKYFEHKISERVKFPKAEAKKFDEKSQAALSFLEESEEEIQVRERLTTVGKKILDSKKMYVCPTLTFVSDAPGATFFQRINPNFDENYKFVRKVLFDKLHTVDKSVTFSSPYLIANSHANKLMKTLLKKKVEISVYTNSLASTDAVYVAANLYYDAFKWASKGIKIYLHDGIYTQNNPDLEEKIQKAKWGTHSKVQVYEATDFTEAMIGTYNIDNRSNFYNSEMAVFCKGNDAFTKVVKDEITEQMNKGIKINKDGSASDRDGNKKSVFGSDKKDLKLMRFIFLPSWLLKFLL